MANPKNKLKSAPKPTETVNHPSHYNQFGKEVIDLIEEACENPTFHIGNSLKYVLRYESKNGLEDLKKALWYLERAGECYLLTSRNSEFPFDKNFQNALNAVEGQSKTTCRNALAAYLTSLLALNVQDPEGLDQFKDLYPQAVRWLRLLIEQVK